MKFSLYTAAVLVAVSFVPNAQANDPYSQTKCIQKDSITRVCRGGGSQFVEISQADWQLITGTIGGETVTCITWGLSSVKEKIQTGASLDTEQICVWGTVSDQPNLLELQRSAP